MTKSDILSEIKRTAAANGNRPLGTRAFCAETGIKKSDWYGLYWARWSDAQKEAGFEANQLQQPLEIDSIIVALAKLTRELGRLPVEGDLRLKKRADPGFPSHSTFWRIGPKAKRLMQIATFCRLHAGYEDVAAICEREREALDREEEGGGSVDHENGKDEPCVGIVYLAKSGGYFKIGYSNSAGRREYELQIQMPEVLHVIHEIRTDDPKGIEEYWHKRFQRKRKNGEWFELDAKEIRAFRRRKFM